MDLLVVWLKSIMYHLRRFIPSLGSSQLGQKCLDAGILQEMGAWIQAVVG